jgi:hypothetical protein
MTTQTPAAAFNLDTVHRFEAWGREYVVYGDGQHREVIPAAQYDRETEETDYSLWCTVTTTAPLHVYRAAAWFLGDYQSAVHGTVQA